MNSYLLCGWGTTELDGWRRAGSERRDRLPGGPGGGRAGRGRLRLLDDTAKFNDRRKGDGVERGSERGLRRHRLAASDLILAGRAEAVLAHRAGHRRAGEAEEARQYRDREHESCDGSRLDPEPCPEMHEHSQHTSRFAGRQIA